MHELPEIILQPEVPGYSVPLETEWSLLRTACSDVPAVEKAPVISGLLGSEVRWNALYALADRHGVLPILAQALLSVEDQVPNEALTALKQSYQANLHKALFLSREFVSITDCLSQAGIEFLPYKGLALAETIYGDVGLRQSGDIDLFIEPGDLSRVRRAVAELGYVPHQTLSADQEEAYLRSGYECAFDGPTGKNLLEVQWAIQPLFYAVDIPTKDLFRRAVKVTVAGAEVKTLSPEDSFVVLALHAAKHAWAKLIWLCDVARISKLPALDWKHVGDQAQALGIVRILRVTLLLAEKLLYAPVPASAQEQVPEDLAARSLADEVGNCISSERTLDVESRAYFKLMVRLRERSTDRMRFLSRLAFTPGPGEWAAMRLPKPLFPLYRLVRLARLGGRVVRGRI